MTEAVVTTLSVLGLANIGLGWYLGYRSPFEYIAFWLLAGLVLLSACRVVRHVFPWTGLADAAIRVGVLSFALIVVAGLALGAAGLLAPVPYLVFFAALFGASLLLSDRSGAPGAAARVGLPTAAILVPLLAFIVAVGIIQSPLTLYDSLSYHLFFPARWLQEHRLSIVPTPFSDPAQAYQPGNGELFFLWLMLPFHGDLLARIGQLPFLLLSGVALYAIARRMGARPEHAVYAPTFYFLARPVVEQAVGADVDLVCAATFVTSLYLGIVAVDRNETRDWMLWGVSLGLYWGSKYLALVYSPVFVLLPFMRASRRPLPRMLWALPGIVVLALPWYLRNWIVAGSPIYPATLQLAGITVARGAFTRAAMSHSVFHTTDVRLFPVMAAHAFGAPLFLFWMPFALLGAASILMRPWQGQRWPAAYVLLVPLVMIPLYWFGLPVNIDSRFLLPAVAVATLPLAFVFGASEKWNAGVQAAYFMGILWVLLGVTWNVSIPVPWYMAGWLSLDGLVTPGSFVVFAGLAAAVAMLWGFASRTTDGRVPVIPVVAAVAALASVILAVGSDRFCAPYRCSLLQLSSPYIRSTMLDGWAWVARNTRHATFAYTGNNVPYPLFGDRLTNRVYYVNIDRHASWRLRARPEPARYHASLRASGARLGRTGAGQRPRARGRVPAPLRADIRVSRGVAREPEGDRRRSPLRLGVVRV